MTRAQVDQTMHGTMCVRGFTPRAVDVIFHWDSDDPAMITLAVYDGEQAARWEVARSLFTAAGSKTGEGAWVGGGDFAVVVTPHGRCSLAFKPHTSDIVTLVALAGRSVPTFMAETLRHVPESAESDVLLARVDQLLADLFGGQE